MENNKKRIDILKEKITAYDNLIRSLDNAFNEAAKIYTDLKAELSELEREKK